MSKFPCSLSARSRVLDAYLSPEMKSTGEAIGYDDKLNRALYKALQASGMQLQNYGTVFVTVADKDKEEALPLIRRFYNLGFNIEATEGTARFLQENGIRTRMRGKHQRGQRRRYWSCPAPGPYRLCHQHPGRCGLRGASIATGYHDPQRCDREQLSPCSPSLDTVRVLLDVLEETTLGVSTIHLTGGRI